jgi:hypothetical protein
MTSNRSRLRKTSIVDAIWCGCESVIRDTLFEIKPPIRLSNIQKSIDAQQQFAQEAPLDGSSNAARIAASVRLASNPYFGSNFSRFEDGLPISSYLPALNPKHRCANLVKGTEEPRPEA